PSQRSVVGTVQDIEERAKRAQLGMPALTIVGRVVALRNHLQWFDTKPLFGKRVLVTRPSHQAGSLSALLRDEGAEPIEAPSLRIVDPPDLGPLHRLLERLAEYHWVIFTSQNGVDVFFREIR